MFHPEPLATALGHPKLAFPDKVPLEHFPVRSFLAESAYYPAAGTDFWPVLALADRCHTFVWADYCVSAEEAVEALHQLHPSELRDVTQEALLDGRCWRPSYRPRCDRGFPYARPFALLARFRVGSEDGRRYAGRISQFFPDTEDLIPREVELLFVGGEGVATYQALYCTQGVAPKVLTILRPGTGFGFNWTDFRAAGDALENAVRDNPGGLPEGLLRDAGERLMGYHWPELQTACDFGPKPDDRVITPVLEWRRPA